ncbi:MAG: hypothetical protein ACLUE7_11250 [Lachnospirales bacterium]
MTEVWLNVLVLILREWIALPLVLVLDLQVLQAVLYHYSFLLIQHLFQVIFGNAFVVVVLGGVGKLLGTFCGADIIGFSSVFMENLTSASIAKFIVLIIVIVFLQKKPQGLFTIRSRSLDD